MDVDQAIDDLYGADLGSFADERQRLARALREQGEPEQAKVVSGLRKPTRAAWLLNQLARRHRLEVDLLLDAGHRLRQAQSELLAGAGQEAFAQAREAQGEALRRLGRSLRELPVAGGASAPVLRQVEETLRTAAIDEQGRELLARGRFVKAVVAGGSGFEMLAEAASQAPKRQASRRSAGEIQEAQTALGLARAEQRRLEREQQEIERELARRRADLERAQAAAEEARRRAADAAQEVQRAKQALERLRRRGRR
ncbi:MAG: hypothetical protein ACXVZP_06050 [Gaiellaceae bacterium]